MGPTLPISEETHSVKYRQEGETFRDAMTRVAGALADNQEHFERFREILLDMAFLPAGRVQCAMGAARETTPYNCFVSPTIPDSMDGIMDVATKAAQTMRLGGGIGYDFSTLRPKGDLIRSLASTSSGPISFMDIFNSVCGTISSAGHRRGAQMGILRVDHPDIREFIHAKANSTRLTNFNISVAVTDMFMETVKADGHFDLSFNGRVYETVRARNLWDEIMRQTWDWAEPGVIFIDRINEMNNLYYCETIAATNPCAEQPLPPDGACLLGSFNLVKYVREMGPGARLFDYQRFREDIRVVVRAMDNVVDRAIYPHEAQMFEARSKRRMGLGVTGVANALEAMGYAYGSHAFCRELNHILSILTNAAYTASAMLAAEKGPFPLFDLDKYLNGEFVSTMLTDDTFRLIERHGIRNSHLTSIAPTGTISLTADNISSGIEPVFSHEFTRTINMPDGVRTETVRDYGVTHFGVKGKTADQCTVEEHLRVLTVASAWMDSSVSKTCNIGDDVTWEQFKDVYMQAYDNGCKGCTTFRASGKRFGILNAKPTSEENEGAACFIDPESGVRTCE
jgi:ribonucleoside-diphosphate reductase alpha chain